MNAGAAGRCLDFALLHDFSVQREVEPFPLDLLRHAEADEHLDHEKDDQADDGVINENSGHADALVEELSNVALQNACGSTVLLDREHPGQKRPNDAADRMNAEAIQRIVIAEQALQAGTSPVAADTCPDSDGKGADGPDETGSRRNSHKAGDRARADADDGRLAL